MRRPDFTLAAGDLAPAIEWFLLNNDGTPVDLSPAGTVVNFVMRPSGASAALINAAAVVVDAKGGHVLYGWAAGNTDTSGRYYAQWRVTWAGGVPESFPPSPIIVDIRPSMR